jgi:glycosyltransferase involved in cell wall biosynthesis
VLRAFAVVQRRFGDARLIVAADGRDRGQLEQLARELALRNAEFIGWVSPDHVADLYSAADIYLNGSDSGDNVPVSILEAFAAGLPVVSTDAGGIPELVRQGETGMLVPRGDHAEMAACALRLLDDPELSSKLAHNAREECLGFTWSARREEWLGLYAELSSRHLSRSDHLTNR